VEAESRVGSSWFDTISLLCSVCEREVCALLVDLVCRYWPASQDAEPLNPLQGVSYLLKYECIVSVLSLFLPRLVSSFLFSIAECSADGQIQKLQSKTLIVQSGQQKADLFLYRYSYSCCDLLIL
jgi:hypothetical protein